MDLSDSDKLVANAVNLAIEIYPWMIASKSSSITEGQEGPHGISSKEVDEAEANANQELEKPSVKKAICSSLTSVGDDLKEVTKVVSAAIIPLSIGGVVAIPLTPLALAVAGLIVFRSGVAAYCSDQKKESKKK